MKLDFQQTRTPLPEAEASGAEKPEKPERQAFPTALDVLMVSETQFDLMSHHKFSKAFIKLTLYFLLNFNVNNGYIHKGRVSEIARNAGVNIADVYAYKKVANTVGLTRFHIKDMKLRGKIRHLAKVRLNEENDLTELMETNKLRVAMIHAEGVRVLMKNRATGSQMLLAIAMAFHCDIKTGTLHEKHPDTWAGLIRRDRTTITRSGGALEGLNEMGFLQTKTDYLVEGRLPYTAYARGWYEQRAWAQDRINAGDAEHHVKVQFMQSVKWLREGYGFCEAFLATPSKVYEAAKALRSWTPKARQPKATVTSSTATVGEKLSKDEFMARARELGLA